jgi:hypothetical protein
MVFRKIPMNLSRLLWLSGVLLLLIGTYACGKNPTTSQPDDSTPIPSSPQPSLTITCSPTAGTKDTQVTVTIAIKDNQHEIGVFGMELTFPPKMFDFLEIAKGSLVNDWAAVDGNEVSAGNLKIGGFKGSGNTIGMNSQGSIAILKFKVDGSDLNNGQQGQICIKSYTDDIAGIPPEPACSSFILSK